MPQPGEPSYSSIRRTPGDGRPTPRSANAAPQAGPRQYEPSGKRFTIDRNALSYMGWTFQVCTAHRLSRCLWALLSLRWHLPMSCVSLACLNYCLLPSETDLDSSQAFLYLTKGRLSHAHQHV